MKFSSHASMAVLIAMTMVAGHVGAQTMSRRIAIEPASLFQGDSANLSIAGEQRLDQAARALIQARTMVVVIGAPAPNEDKVGAPRSAVRRAFVVRQRLEAAGTGRMAIYVERRLATEPWTIESHIDTSSPLAMHQRKLDVPG
jgi:hypothetical protein